MSHYDHAYDEYYAKMRIAEKKDYEQKLHFWRSLRESRMVTSEIEHLYEDILKFYKSKLYDLRDVH